MLPLNCSAQISGSLIQAEHFLWWNKAMQIGQVVWSQTHFVSWLCLYLSQLQDGLLVHDPRQPLLLLICHHWTQCQSLLAGWQKKGAALPDCSWKAPPLRPDIYRSPRGIHTHCHLSPKAIWGYRPCFTALTQHTGPCSAQVHQQVQGGSIWQ